jgi:sterol desaturase/sphingolipid hydroxylase (fatty acid hydroxylase superfamily)
MNTYITAIVLIGLWYFADPDEKYEWWLRLVDVIPFQVDDRMKYVIISHGFLETGFWFLVINLFLLERTGFMDKYRIQSLPTDPEQIAKESALTKEAFQGVLVSHWIVRPFILYAVYPMFEMRAGPLRTPIPSLRTVFPQILGCMLIDDVWFYFWHRLFHVIPWLYRSVHKQHHKFYRPNVFATEYAHIVEDIWVNSIGTLLGPLVLGVHPFLMILYPAMKLYQSMEAHSGYNIPFPLSITSVIDSMDCAPAHDFHHSHVMSNYGGWFMFLDWIFGTDEKYQNHIMNKRNDDAVYETARRPYKNDGIGMITQKRGQTKTE